MKPKCEEVARTAIESVNQYTYQEMDCQAFVEHCINENGGNAYYSGSNDMARNAAWLGTLENAKAEGKLVLGACVLIWEDDGGEPEKYKGDGLGNFSHIGIYVGENALKDVDKRGRTRACNVVHSSQSMGRVAGSTLQNAWTHVMLFNEVDYGFNVPAGVTVPDQFKPTKPKKPRPQYKAAYVSTPDGNPVKMRKSTSKQEKAYWKVENGQEVLVERQKGEWSLCKATCTDGYDRRAYIMTKYLWFDSEG